MNRIRPGRAPKPPTLIPIMFLALCVLIALLAWMLERHTTFSGWIALSLLPLALVLLPAEIIYSQRRRRICRYIREDFMVEEVGVQADYGSLLAEIHDRSRHRRRKAHTDAIRTTGPSTWPNTVPSSN